MGAAMSTGATRDLWKPFSEARDRAHGGRYKKKTFGGDGMELQSMTRMEEGRVSGPEWMDIVDNVKSTVAKLQDNLQLLADAQVKQLKGGDNLFDVHEEQNRRDDVDLLNKKIGKLFNSANSMVKGLTASGVGSNDDARVRKNIQMGLAGELQTLSSKFRKKHKEFLRAISEQRSRVDDSGFKFTPPEDDDDAEGDMGWSQSQLQEIGTMDHIIDERDKEITKIAQSVSELAQLFRELSVLVIDQGTILDRIDYNMEEVVMNFEQAEEQLEQTEKIMKKGWSAYCILILCIMCILMATILVIKKATESDG